MMANCSELDALLNPLSSSPTPTLRELAVLSTNLTGKL